jgi:spore coat protein CotH
MKLKKISLFAICFFSLPGLIKAQTEGDNFFAMPQVHDVYLTFSQPNYWDSLVAYMPMEKYLKASISIDGLVLDDVGIKFKGNSSYSNPSDKKPFKVDLNEFVSGQKLDGLNKFNLNNGFKDPSFMREKIALDFYRDHGISAPRCAYTRVYINGTYWGLYDFVEEVNKTFLDDDDHFGNKQGNLFKGDPMGDLKWINSSPSSYYPKYELHTNETANDWSDLINLIDKINNSGSYFHDSLEAAFNTNTFIKHWAAMNMFANLDSYIGSGHNYFLYHDTLSGKFEWVTWDVNESFGNFNMGMTTTQIKNLSMFFVSSPATSRPLVQKMLNDPDYKTELINTICEWLSTDFTNGHLDPKIDSLANSIRAAVYADTKKFYSNMDFETNLSSDVGNTMGIKSFITSRRNALVAELALNGCNVGVNEITSADYFNVYPNPAANTITVEFNNMITSLKITNMLGQEVYSSEPSTNNLTINISELPSGIYSLNINNSLFKKVQKIK